LHRQSGSRHAGPDPQRKGHAGQENHPGDAGLQRGPVRFARHPDHDGRVRRIPGALPEAERREIEVKDDNPMYLRDYSKCVLCWRCVQVCAEDAQYTYAINFSGRGYETEIGTFFDRTIPESTCVFCGQCVGVCPTGALKPKREFLLEQGISPEEITVMSSGRKKKKRT
jgi:predicted molibdopterin-dependent oxidoreductase YjgC